MFSERGTCKIEVVEGIRQDLHCSRVTLPEAPRCRDRRGLLMPTTPSLCRWIQGGSCFVEFRMRCGEPRPEVASECARQVADTDPVPCGKVDMSSG